MLNYYAATMKMFLEGLDKQEELVVDVIISGILEIGEFKTLKHVRVAEYRPWISGEQISVSPGNWWVGFHRRKL